MTSMPHPLKTRRRWLQFSLGAMFVVVTLIALVIWAFIDIDRNGGS
jgi:hypothetical protein